MDMATGVRIQERMEVIEVGPRRLPVYIAEPNDARILPGLIVIHEIFGLNEHIKDVSRRFAYRGLRVYAPDLFAGADGLPEDRDSLDAMRTVWESIADSQLIDDLKSVLSMAEATKNVNATKIGAIGYCMGGAIAFMFACETVELAWVIDYYGRVTYPELSANKPIHPVDYAPGLRCPVLALFSGIDPLIPPEDIELFTSTLEKLGKSGQIKVYRDAPHAFFNDRRENYNAQAAEDAWKLTVDFIARNTLSRP